jgi:hypothetical protein
VVEYAAKGFVTKAWVEERVRLGQPLGRSFCGIPVEVGGRMWGVLVFDSRNPNEIKGVDVYQEFGAVLSKLLKME